MIPPNPNIDTLDQKAILEAIIADVIGAIIFAFIVLIAGAFFTIRNWSSIKRFFLKNWYRFFPISFNAAISIEAEPGKPSGIYYSQMLSNLNDSISQMGLSEVIKLRDLGGVQKFKTQDEVEKYRTKTNLDLIIWGKFTKDELQENGIMRHEVSLSFTYPHPKDAKGILKKLISRELQQVLSKQRFGKILQNDSFEHVQIMSESLTEMALYVLGLTTLLLFRLSESQTIFEKLLLRAPSQNADFSNGVKIHLVNIYDIHRQECLRKKNYEQALAYANMILAIAPIHPSALATKAAALVKLGHISDGEKVVSQLVQHYPSSALTYVDLAYFRILKNEYGSALNHYKKIVQTKNLDFDVIEACCFLEDQYDEGHAEPAFLFGAGFLNIHFGDNNRGRRLLRRFLRLTSKNTHKRMWGEAKKILED